MDSEHDSDLEVKPEDLETDHEEDMEEDGASSEDNESDDSDDDNDEEAEQLDEIVAQDEDDAEDDADDDVASMNTDEGEQMAFKAFADKLTFVTEDNDEIGDSEDEEEEKDGPAKVYLPKGDEEEQYDPDDLEYDESAYITYERIELGLPCLSFDMLEDGLGSGDQRLENWPQTAYFVTGTQAPRGSRNTIMVMKIAKLNKFKASEKGEKSMNEDIDDGKALEGGDGPKSPNAPQFFMASIPHQNCVNRIRATSIGTNRLAASWSENGSVYIWDLSKALEAIEDVDTLETFNKRANAYKPSFTFKGHKTEGFAMDWSNLKKGMLATGDCDKNIHIWRPKESFHWNVENRPLMGHKKSVEDLQWSPSEDNVLASCSVDKSIRIWDIRAKPTSACMLSVQDAHDSDINVISWNRSEQMFIVSGGDDGVIKTWDLRQFGSKNVEPLAKFKHHTGPITSIEWNPNDSTVFAASGEDNQITIWDLAVEKDDEESDDEEADKEVKDLPPQLLFIHHGARELKELHFHPQIPGLIVSTAATGFDIFKTISV